MTSKLQGLLEAEYERQLRCYSALLERYPAQWFCIAAAALGAAVGLADSVGYDVDKFLRKLRAQEPLPPVLVPPVPRAPDEWDFTSRGDQMTADTVTLGEALPREMSRVRDEVLAVYLTLGPEGAPASILMRRDLDLAAKALAEGDVAEMLYLLDELRGWEL